MWVEAFYWQLLEGYRYVFEQQEECTGWDLRPWDGVIMLHSSAAPHTSWQTQPWFQYYEWEVLQHAADNPDLAPSNFNLVGPWSGIYGQHLVNDDVAAVVMTWLHTIDLNCLVKGFIIPVSCCYKCFSSFCRCVDFIGK